MLTLSEIVQIVYDVQSGELATDVERLRYERYNYIRNISHGIFRSSERTHQFRVHSIKLLAGKTETENRDDIIVLALVIRRACHLLRYAFIRKLFRRSCIRTLYYKQRCWEFSDEYLVPLPRWSNFISVQD